jgi:hypothetical protein
MVREYATFHGPVLVAEGALEILAGLVQDEVRMVDFHAVVVVIFDDPFSGEIGRRVSLGD